MGNLYYFGIPENHLSVSYCHRFDKRAVNDVLVIHEILAKQCIKYMVNNTSTVFFIKLDMFLNYGFIYSNER
jgi:hypothetical protein